jgi:predicted RNA binding protein YcfA (HicA-like mRNA interferase family)
MPVRTSGKDVVRALVKDGWVVHRISGSHHVLRNADGKTVSIPVHGSRPLPVGTLAAICREAGRTARELKDLR